MVTITIPFLKTWLWFLTSSMFMPHYILFSSFTDEAITFCEFGNNQ